MGGAKFSAWTLARRWLDSRRDQNDWSASASLADWRCDRGTSLSAFGWIWRGYGNSAAKSRVIVMTILFVTLLSGSSAAALAAPTIKEHWENELTLLELDCFGSI